MKSLTTLAKLKFNRLEMAGAFGDIGTLIPLTLGLVIVGGMNPTSLFLSAGLFYIIAGLYFRIPMAVQPLKAVASIAIGAGLGVNYIAAAAFLMGIIIPLISLRPVANFISKIFTKPIVRGIQLGVGLMLIRKGWRLIEADTISAIGFGEAVSYQNYLPYLVAACALLIILLLARSKRFPAILVVMAFGLGLGLLTSTHLKISQVELGPVWPTFELPIVADLWPALILLVIPQLPLTLGNAIVASSDTAKSYYGEGARRVSIRSLAASIGLANLTSSLFQGMPMCHGSGGITAHYKFGARTGGANIIIGGILLVMALLFGKTLMSFLGVFPLSILGVLLAYVGFLHALFIKDLWSKWNQLAVATTIGLTTLVANNLAIAFSLGIVLNLILNLISNPKKVVREM